jgi:hypothetical protein
MLRTRQPHQPHQPHMDGQVLLHCGILIVIGCDVACKYDYNHIVGTISSTTIAALTTELYGGESLLGS